MVKQILYRLIAVLFTFAIGVNTLVLWHNYRTISFCELDENPRLYAGKVIRLRAIFQSNGGTISAGSFCKPFEAPAARIELAPDQITNFPLPESVLSSDGTLERSYLMDAVITGEMDESIGPGCWGPKYHIKNVKVERVNSIREFDDFQKAVEWLKSNSY